MKILPVAFLVISLTAVFFFFFLYFAVIRKKDPVADIEEFENCCLSYPRRSYSMTRADILPLAIITVLYSLVAFWGLGNNKGPESFCSFTERGRYVDVALTEGTLVSRISYYCGLHTGNYYLQTSMDGVEFTDVCVLKQDYADIFKWKEAPLEQSLEANYIRLIADDVLDLGELCIYDWAGTPIYVGDLGFNEGAAPLFDEQKLVPPSYSYMNSTYFDEIYHVRTAYEHLTGVYPYELSHPPLGKVIIGAGIDIFGLNPFGWRFMGVLFGVLMLPALYILLKSLFGSTAISACGTAIFAFDFMHYTQTRIATIDTYGVFFILLMFLFMYKWISFPREDPFAPRWKGTAYLFLSGLSFGLGAASKWTVIYGGAGLALIWLLYRLARGRELVKTGHSRQHRRELIVNILQCIGFFVIIPAVIYYLSYTPYGLARGMSAPAMYFDPEYMDIVIKNQEFMFGYHAGVSAEHPYSSKWYQWIVDGRPILYYLNSMPNNIKSTFGCFMNPLVCWGGLLAVAAMVWQTVKHRDGKALFILIGYLSSLVPWMFISRVTFAYHYFPCLIFLVLSICHVFNSFRLRDPGWKVKVFGATAACLLLFAVFYPVLSGVAAPRKYLELLSWIPGAWPF